MLLKYHTKAHLFTLPKKWRETTKNQKSISRFNVTNRFWNAIVLVKCQFCYYCNVTLFLPMINKMLICPWTLFKFWIFPLQHYHCLSSISISKHINVVGFFSIIALLHWISLKIVFLAFPVFSYFEKRSDKID